MELRDHHAVLLRLNGGAAMRPAKILACDPVVEYDEKRIDRESIIDPGIFPTTVPTRPSRGSPLDG